MKSLALVLVFITAAMCAAAQGVALIEPEKEARIAGLADSLHRSLRSQFRVLDASMSEAAFRSVESENYLNLSTADARRIGTVVGSDVFILLRSTAQRRESLDRPAYFEAYAAAYLVDSRSGNLFAWVFENAEASTADDASAKLMRSTILPDRIAAALKVNRLPLKKDPKFEEVPPPDSPLGKGLRAPIPYRRVRPVYTDAAFYYGIRATIDIEVDIDTDGSIARTSIERWAGYGLEESVEKAVRTMNWRPAERNGKPLPMRVLLRYNFTKIEKDEAY